MRSVDAAQVDFVIPESCEDAAQVNYLCFLSFARTRLCRFRVTELCEEKKELTDDKGIDPSRAYLSGLERNVFDIFT